MCQLITSDKVCMYQVSLKSEGVCPFFVITWPGITHIRVEKETPAKFIRL